MNKLYKKYPLFDPEKFHDACGVGFVATKNGKAEGRTFGSAFPFFVATKPTPHASWNFSGSNNGYFLCNFFK